jgi:hypothetical protein
MRLNVFCVLVLPVVSLIIPVFNVRSEYYELPLLLLIIVAAYRQQVTEQEVNLHSATKTKNKLRGL